MECEDKTSIDTEKLYTLLVVTIVCRETLSLARLPGDDKLRRLLRILERTEPYRPGIFVSWIFHPFMEPNSCGHNTVSVKSPFVGSRPTPSSSSPIASDTIGVCRIPSHQCGLPTISLNLQCDKHGGYQLKPLSNSKALHDVR